MTALTRDQIKATDDRKMERVDVPDWGGHVFVRVMSGTAKDAYEGSCINADGSRSFDNMRAKLAIATCCDEAGAPLFTMTDLPWLAEKSGAALTDVWTVALRLNRMTKKDVKELEGNSNGAQSAGSTSD